MLGDFDSRSIVGPSGYFSLLLQVFKLMDIIFEQRQMVRAARRHDLSFVRH